VGKNGRRGSPQKAPQKQGRVGRCFTQRSDQRLVQLGGGGAKNGPGESCGKSSFVAKKQRLYGKRLFSDEREWERGEGGPPSEKGKPSQKLGFQGGGDPLLCERARTGPSKGKPEPFFGRKSRHGGENQAGGKKGEPQARRSERWRGPGGGGENKALKKETRVSGGGLITRGKRVSRRDKKGLQ